MHTATEFLQRWRSMTPAQWIVFAWLMLGLVCVAIGISRLFIPSEAAERGLVLVSLVIGGSLAVWSLYSPRWRGSSKALSSFDRAILAILCALMFALMGSGNIYMALFALHGAVAQPEQRPAIISSKATGLDLPGRCKHYVRFTDLPFIYVMRACVSQEAFDSVKAGSKVTLLGSGSLFGFRLNGFEPLQANPTAETDARKGSARGSP